MLPFVEEHLANILVENTIKQSERVHILLDEMSDNQPVWDAFANLGLQSYTNQLTEVQTAIDNSLSSRTLGKSMRPRMKTGAVKTALADTLTDLLNEIEIASRKYPTLDYQPLMNELHEFLTPIQAKIKANRTRNRNANAPSDATASPAELVA